VLDRIRQIFHRLLKAETIEDALQQVVSPKLVCEIAEEIEPEHLIEEVATELDVDPRDLLETVCSRIENLIPAQPLSVPTTRLVETVGYDAETLHAAYVIPQEPITADAPYILVVADPMKIDLEEFRKEGIRILLATGEEIDATWKKYQWAKRQFGSKVNIGQMFQVLKQLATDAHECGAQEVFIGDPEEDTYEFLAEDKKYQGKLHPAMYTALLDLFKEQPRISRTVEDSLTLRSLSISLTRSFKRPVVCLTWELVPTEQRIEVTQAEEPGKRPDSDSEETIVEASETPEIAEEKSLPAEKASERAKKTILVVDDDPRFSMILGRILESKGFVVETRLHGKAALECLDKAEVRPDLVISDVHMPQMDGGSFLKALRELRKRLPVLMLTSDDDRLLEAELALLGADAFVRKQEDPKVLLAWCNNLLARSATFAAEEQEDTDVALAVSNA